MYKAKITEISKEIYKVNIPSLGLSSVTAHLVIDKGNKPLYSVGDLVIVTELNTGEFVILGYVFNGN